MLALLVIVFCLHFNPASARAAATRLLSVNYDFGPPQIERTGADSRVAVPECQTSQRLGEPCLPFRTACILLPPGSRIEKLTTRLLADSVSLAAPGPVEHGRAPVSPANQNNFPGESQPAAAIYNADAPYPTERAELVSVQIMGGHPIAIVRLFPVQYRPTQGRLVFCPRLAVELTLSSPVTQAATPFSSPRTQAQAAGRVAAFVDNPDGLIEYQTAAAKAPADAAPALPHYDYLLVTKSFLLPSFQPLVELKIADGLAVKTASMENILASQPGRDAPEKLRNYIRSAYTNWSVRYVLLGGDIDTVPVRYAYVNPTGLDPNSSIPCDLYYSCLDGSWNSDGDNRWGEPTDGEGGGDVDLLGEVYVGRAPVDTVEEANRWVEKTVRHEVIGTPNPTNALFLARYLGFFAPGVQAQGGRMLDPLLPKFNASGFQVNWLDDRPFTTDQWTKSNAISALNRSPQVAVYNGHGDYDWIMEMYVPDVDSLTNRYPFFAYSVGCNAGEFDNDPFSPDCVGEELLKRHSRGAFAAVLNSRLGWFNPVNEEQYSGEFQTRFFFSTCWSAGTPILARPINFPSTTCWAMWNLRGRRPKPIAGVITRSRSSGIRTPRW